MSISSREGIQFKRFILDYYRVSGRHDLPWRSPSLRLQRNKAILDPYRIFISEVMLQQTQVARVLKKYPEFLRAFPDFKTLAGAPLSKVLGTWSGMGYNRRAMNLKRATETVVSQYAGKLPDTLDTLTELPGIGKATAASILTFAFNQPTVFIETNIRRTFIHHFFSPKSQKKHSNILKNVGMLSNISDGEIAPLVRKTLDRKNPREWYWALMDYGAMLAKASENPNRRSRHYTKQSRFEGSRRQARAALLNALLDGGSLRATAVPRLIKRTEKVATEVVKALEKEGFVRQLGKMLLLSS